jgi:hypothetical protein
VDWYRILSRFYAELLRLMPDYESLLFGEVTRSLLLGGNTGRKIMDGMRDRREVDGATYQDDDGRYYAIAQDEHNNQTGRQIYGFSAWFTGEYVCYTCGHVCDCE